MFQNDNLTNTETPASERSSTASLRSIVMICLGAYFSTWAIMIDAGMTIRNITSILLFGLLVLFYRRTSQMQKENQTQKRRGWTSYETVSLLFALLFLLAKHEAYTASFSSGLFQIMTLAVVLLGMFFLAQNTIWFLDDVIQRLSRSNTLRTHSPEKREASDAKKWFLLTFVICMICYLPYFLYEYPGIISPDGAWQIEQVVGARPWSNHHPAIHTAVIWLFTKLGLLFTNDINVAVSVYVFFQMTFHAFCGAVAVATIRKSGFRKMVCALALAFYALIPFQAVYAVFVCKDTPFSDIAVLFICVIINNVQQMKDGSEKNANKGAGAGKCNENRLNKKSLVAFTILAVLFCLFRSNGWYAFLVMIPFLLILMRKYLRQIVPVLIVIVLTAGIVRGPVMNFAGVEQTDFIESCCVPLQQIARVVVDGKEISEEDRALISNAVIYEDIASVYDPTFADNMKELVRADGMQDYIVEHKGDYLKLWMRLGVKYPSTYLQAWADLTKGFWFPDYDYETANIDNVFANLAGVSWQPILRGQLVVKVKEIFIKLGSFLPLYGLLWSSGTYVWLLFLMTAILLRRGQKKELLIILPLLAILATLYIAVPLAAEFRYTYALTMTLPLWLLAPWIGGMSENN